MEGGRKQCTSSLLKEKREDQRTQEHSKALVNSTPNVSEADEMLLRDESFPDQGFTLQQISGITWGLKIETLIL